MAFEYNYDIDNLVIRVTDFSMAKLIHDRFTTSIDSLHTITNRRFQSINDVLDGAPIIESYVYVFVFDETIEFEDVADQIEIPLGAWCHNNKLLRP